MTTGLLTDVAERFADGSDEGDTRYDVVGDI